MIFWEQVLFWLMAIGYTGSLVLHAYWFTLQRQKGQVWERVLIYLGLGCNLAAVVARTLISGHLPLALKYEGALVVALLTMGAFTLWRRRSELVRQFGIVCLPFTLLILFVGFASSPDVKPLTAAYLSRWLAIHAIFTILGSVCFVFALGSSVFYLLKSRYPEGGEPIRYQNLPTLAVLNDLNFRLVLFGFVCWTVMMVSGMLWAKDLWGSYWSWDPIETWSLFSWLAWGVYVHLHFTYGWGGRRMAWIFIFSFLTTIVSVWAIELVTPSTYHNLQQIISPWNRQ